MASFEVPECVLVGVGNPLLDITITTDQSFLDKYNLKSNNAIVATDATYREMFSEMMEKHKPVYVAGGATQNSIRVAQWILQRPRATSFFGGVGNDKMAELLEAKAKEAGVLVRYCKSSDKPTGICGAVITGEDRSLIADVGAAETLNSDFIRSRKNWLLIEAARYYYIGGFVFPICTQGIFDIAQHACDNTKTFIMNLSATFLCKYFADKDNDIMPFIDVLIGNETEAAEFCKLRGISRTTIKDMALATSLLPKRNTSANRLVIFTQGKDPVIIAQGGKVFVFPVSAAPRDVIKDTNGCGDAFVGGYLSQLVQGKNIKECVKCGMYASTVVIQNWGCTFPDKPDF